MTPSLEQFDGKKPRQPRFTGNNHVPQRDGGPKRPPHHSGKKIPIQVERIKALEMGRAESAAEIAALKKTAMQAQAEWERATITNEGEERARVSAEAVRQAPEAVTVWEKRANAAEAALIIEKGRAKEFAHGLAAESKRAHAAEEALVHVQKRCRELSDINVNLEMEKKEAQILKRMRE
jgi:hypothetical protein